MNAFEVVQKAIPDATKSIADHILWGMTPFPMGAVSVRSIYKAAARFKRAEANGIRLCDCCDNKAMPNGYYCQPCHDCLVRYK